MFLSFTLLLHVLVSSGVLDIDDFVHLVVHSLCANINGDILVEPFLLKMRLLGNTNLVMIIVNPIKCVQRVVISSCG